MHGFDFSQDVDGPVVTAAQRSLEALANVACPEMLPQLRKSGVIALADATGHAETLMPLFLAIEREKHLQAAGQATAGMALRVAIGIQMARWARVNELTPSHSQRKCRSPMKALLGTSIVSTWPTTNLLTKSASHCLSNAVAFSEA